MKFEYQTSYFPVDYKPNVRGKWIFKSEAPQHNPDPSSIYNNPEYHAHLNKMGKEGWELISVQPLLRGMYEFQKDSNSGFGFGYSLTAGYYFFWKREI